MMWAAAEHSPTHVSGLTSEAVREGSRGMTWNQPLRNVWLGVSVENQQWAQLRIPALLQTPAAVRFLSCEPLLGPLNLTGSGTNQKYWLTGEPTWGDVEPGPVPMRSLVQRPSIDWVIVGGESGHGARPMDPDWARSLRDQCVAAGVPFLFKQWGAWGPAEWKPERRDAESDDDYKARAEAVGATHAITNPLPDGSYGLYQAPHRPWSIERAPGSIAPYAPVRRWGKKVAGRELDGRTWDEFPAVANG